MGWHTQKNYTGSPVALACRRADRLASRFISAAILLSAIAVLLVAILPPMNIAGADTVRNPGKSVGQGGDGAGAPAAAEPAMPYNTAASDDPSPDHTAEDQLEAWVVVGATDTGAQPALVLSADEEAAAIAAGWAPPR